MHESAKQHPPTSFCISSTSACRAADFAAEGSNKCSECTWLCAVHVCFTGTAHSHWFSWAGCSWQLSCVCNKDDDTFSLRVSFCPKEADQCTAYIALHVMDRRDDSQHCSHYLPCQLFSTQQPSATQEEVLQLSTLLQPRSPFLLNDSLLVVAHLSTEPISFEQAAGQMQENPFNFSSSTNSIRPYSSDSGSSRTQPTPSPFASMFTGDLTRFLSGTAFAEVRLGAMGADPSARNHLPCHASRLTRVSEVLRLQLGPLLKTLPARPLGYGGPEAQPLVLLHAELSVLRVFHQMLYQGSVSVPAAVLAGLLQLAVLYDMPELELWILQQSAAAKQKLAPGSGGSPSCYSSMVDRVINQVWFWRSRCRL